MHVYPSKDWIPTKLSYYVQCGTENGGGGALWICQLKHMYICHALLYNVLLNILSNAVYNEILFMIPIAMNVNNWKIHKVRKYFI